MRTAHEDPRGTGTMPRPALGFRASPNADAHAQVLISVYGEDRALRIARRNSRIAVPMDYWGRVLEVIEHARLARLGDPPAGSIPKIRA